MSVVGYLDGYINENNQEYGLTDLVAQNGIKANTKLIKDTVGWTNKNEMLRSGVVKQDSTYLDLTRKTQADYSIFVNGTPSGDVGAQIYSGFLKAGKHILNGCIDGGSDSKYNLQLYYDNDAHNVKDYGNGVEFTSSTDGIVKAYLNVKSGVTVTNAYFKPMIRDANILDDSYAEPRYTTAFPRDEQAVLSARNILDIEAWFKSADISYTKNGNEYAITTVKSTKYQFAESDIDIKVTGTIANGTATNVRVRLYDSNNTQIAEATQNSTFVLKGKGCKIGFYYGDSGSATATEFMITLGTDESTNFSPFTMSNEQLTKSVTPVDGLSGIEIAEGVGATMAGDCYLKKIGNVVYANIILNGVTAAAYADILTIPAGFRPPKDIYLAIKKGGVDSLYLAKIYSTGKMQSLVAFDNKNLTMITTSWLVS